MPRSRDALHRHNALQIDQSAQVQLPTHTKATIMGSSDPPPPPPPPQNPLLLVPGVCGTQLAVRKSGSSGDGDRCWVNVRDGADEVYRKVGLPFHNLRQSLLYWLPALVCAADPLPVCDSSVMYYLSPHRAHRSCGAGTNTVRAGCSCSLQTWRCVCPRAATTAGSLLCLVGAAALCLLCFPIHLQPHAARFKTATGSAHRSQSVTASCCFNAHLPSYLPILKSFQCLQCLILMWALQ